MTQPPNDLEALAAKAADAYEAFALARNAMNAARPDPMRANPAERALYDERYKADHEAERAHWTTAIELAQNARTILTALRAQVAVPVACPECGGDGIIGYLPDDLQDCPTCRPQRPSPNPAPQAVAAEGDNQGSGSIDMKVWDCKIGSREPVSLPSGADSPMRKAIAAAYKELTGTDAEFIFSGWGGGLEERELAVVENRLPVEPAPWVGDGDSQYPTASNGEKDAVPKDGDMDEARALKELALLYNHNDSDEPQFTRWQMVVAIAHGFRIARPTASNSDKDAVKHVARLVSLYNGLPMDPLEASQWMTEAQAWLALANRGEDV